MPFHPVPMIAAGTRRLQSLQPDRPLKGLTRLFNALHHLLPDYQGVVQLPDGLRLYLDSRQPAERWLLYSGNYQPALTHFLHQHVQIGGYCIDVGANLGYYTVKLARWVGPQGRVAAFEANPTLVKRIQQHVSLNAFSHVDVVPKAVHSEAGRLTFYVSSAPGKSSVQADHVPHPVETLEVEATTIDDYVQNWPRLDIIKMDVEGNDCNALLGAKQSLARFHPIIVFEFWYNTPTQIAQAAFSFLEKLGYTCRTLARDGQQTTFNWRELPQSSGHIDVVCT